MDESNKEDFAKSMMGIGETYDKNISKELMATYWNVLKRFDINEVVDAFGRHLENTDNGQFFPKPADIIRAIQGSTEGRSLNAWTLVDKSIRTIGPYQDVVFDDALIHSVIDDMGGWVSLCSTNDTEYPFKANEFKTRYRSLQSNPPDSYPQILSGLATISNKNIKGQTRGVGYKVKPTLIGSPERCKIVYQGGETGPIRQIWDSSILEDTVKKITGKSKVKESL
jgi:hypothetical protein